MKQERGREYRIRQANRRKQIARKQFQENEWRASDKAIGIHANTPARCSCDMCGNPRKYNGNSHHAKTQQELIALTADDPTDILCSGSGED